jgi:hypothetical protein
LSPGGLTSCHIDVGTGSPGFERKGATGWLRERKLGLLKLHQCIGEFIHHLLFDAFLAGVARKYG